MITIRTHLLFTAMATISLIGCGGGGGSSKSAADPAASAPAATDAQAAAPLDPWLGSWEWRVSAECQQRLTLYADQTFVWTEAKSVVSGRYELLEVPETVMQLNFLYSNGQSNCYGNPSDWAGETLEVPYQLSPRETLQWTLQLTAEDGSTTPVDLFWEAIGDQLLVQGDPFVANYQTPFKSGVLSQIERIAFKVEQKFNGAYFYPAFVPMVLFDDGSVCADISILVANVGIAEHRSLFPEKWGQWQLRDDDLYYDFGDGMTAAYSNRAATVLAQLEGRYSNLQGVSLGGLANTWLMQSYEFFADGRFAVSRSSSTSAGIDVSDPAAVAVFLNGLGASEKGRYEIDGYHLTLHFESGHTAHQTVMAAPASPSDSDPNDATKVVWLNGVAYTRDESR